MRYRIFLTLILFFEVGFNPAVHAETLDLDQAVSYALAHNPELLAARERTNAAQARTQVASGARLPSLGASYSVRASNNPLDVFADKLNTRQVAASDFDPARLNHPGTSDLYTTQLALRLPLYSGGRLTANKLNAEELEKTAQLEYQRARELTAFQTRRAYLSVLAAQENLAIAEDAVKAAQEHARTTA
ncbi:MAG: TolC family protein, partial [Gammaproteobacteria bacterium]|nr:TolC family protein [Gammaproteobacteria bacterium]